MNLEGLTDFNLVATHGGFAQASRASKRPKATLSRHVQELEQGLGVRLIERSTRGSHLTEEGRGFHARIAGLITELEEAADAVASRAPIARGSLRVSAPVVFSHVLLSGMAAKFALAFPQVELEIVADDGFVDPVEDGFDVVLRMNPATDEGLVGRCVLRDERWLVAAPSMASPLPKRSTVSPIAIPVVMSSGAKSKISWQIRTLRNLVLSVEPEPILRLSSLLMVRQAVLSGVGAALLPKLLVEQDIEADRLRRWGVEEGAPVEIWALYNSRRLLSAKVRAFMNWLVSELSTER